MATEAERADRAGDGGDELRSYDRPSVTVDLALLTVREGCLQVLVIRRDRAPFREHWALPGGFVRIDEPLEAAARRILRDKARLDGVFVEQLYTFGAVDRDPRGRVISVAHFALVDGARLDSALERGDGLALAAIEVPWPGEAGGPVAVRTADGRALPLAFDHDRILGMAVKRLRGKLDYSPVGFELLPDRFTLRELQEVHEAILGTRLNKPAFRRRMLDKRVLQPTGARESGVTYRPAELYRFVERAADNTTREEEG